MVKSAKNEILQIIKQADKQMLEVYIYRVLRQVAERINVQAANTLIDELQLEKYGIKKG